MRVGGAQSWHRHLAGIAARDQVADDVIGFHRCTRLDVAEHRCGQRRAFRDQDAKGALKERCAGGVAFGSRDRLAFVEHTEDEILAAG